MQGSKVMHQSRAGTLAPDEPDELIAHVRVCGWAGWVTTGSTRKPTAPSGRFVPCGCRWVGAAAQRQRWVAQAMRNVTECEELLDRLCFRRNSEDFCFEQQLNRQI